MMSWESRCLCVPFSAAECCLFLWTSDALRKTSSAFEIGNAFIMSALMHEQSKRLVASPCMGTVQPFRTSCS